MELIKCIVWYSIQNGGDGSAYPMWFLNEEKAEEDQENMSEGWGEICTGSIETFVGSDVYNEALENENEEEEYESQPIYTPPKSIDYRIVNLNNERLELAYKEGALSDEDRNRLSEINRILINIYAETTTII